MPRRLRQCPRLLAGILTVSIATSVPRVDARVSWNRGAIGNSTKALESIGGTLAYEADVTINSGRGHLTVMAFDAPTDRVLKDMRTLFGTDDIPLTGSLAVTTLRQRHDVLRLVVIDLPDYAKTIAFAIEQSASEYDRSGDSPDPEPLGGKLPIPEGDATFFARDDRAGMAMLQQRAPLPPSASFDTYARQLATQGWKQTLPTGALDSNAHPKERFGIFLKRTATCAVLSTASDRPGASQMTILLKEPGKTD